MICSKNHNNKPIEEFILVSPAPVDTAAKLSSTYINMSNKVSPRFKCVIYTYLWKQLHQWQNRIKDTYGKTILVKSFQNISGKRARERLDRGWQTVRKHGNWTSSIGSWVRFSWKNSHGDRQKEHWIPRHTDWKWTERNNRAFCCTTVSAGLITNTRR